MPVKKQGRLAHRIVDWQRSHGRHDLPWQDTKEPYKVWLSEIMLQQTQVSTVIDYYHRFLSRFPTVGALAKAHTDDVLALWAGLGYYARARNLHACAQAIVNDWQGQFPTTSEQLQSLPGVGASTAAAIAAFCYGERAAILDGNVKRVLTRYHGIEDDITLAATTRKLWAIATDELPKPDLIAQQPDAMSRYTQGMMDLGATVCVRSKPACGQCPLQSDCLAWRSGNPAALPVKRKASRQKPDRKIDLIWITHNRHVLLEKRPDRGVWGGLWCLPADLSIVRTWCAQAPLAMASFAHELTHFRMIVTPWRIELPSSHAQPALDRDNLRWVAQADLAAYGLPKPVHMLLKTNDD